MATTTSIEWTQKTWNPVVGCTRISEGCRHCYAERMSFRQKNMALVAKNPGRQRHYLNVINASGHWNNRVELVEEALSDPLSWHKPSFIFVNSMSDLLHKDVPLEFIQRVFAVMRQAHWHTFQILTKRADRLAELSAQLDWATNIWMGVSIEGVECLHRLVSLKRTGAAVKWLSLEPLLGPLPGIDLSGIDWVVVGGESGPGCRPMQADWAHSLRDQCVAARIPFFFKQWGHICNNPDPSDPTAKQNGGTTKGGRFLDGRAWDEMPVMRGNASQTKL